MKWIVLCFAVSAVISGSDAVTCYTAADGTNEECQDTGSGAPTQCYQPKFTDGFATSNWGCGPCTNADICEECTGTVATSGDCTDPTTLNKFQCYTYSTASVTVGAAGDCFTQDNSINKCNMPKSTANNVKLNGCGGVPSSEEANYDVCNTELCNVKKCNSDSEGTLAACDADATKCKSPLFTDYEGYADTANWGCGECSDENVCKDCDITIGGESCSTTATKTFKCHNYNGVNLNGESDCLVEESTAVECNMPKSAGNVVKLNGCGGVLSSEEANYDVCETELCNVKKCNSDSEGTLAECAADATKCKSPLFVDYEGYADTNNWGCGQCSDEMVCKDCDITIGGQSCKTTETHTFQCYNYKVENDKVVKGDETSCLTEVNTDVVCNYPVDKSNTKYTAYKSGCGPCEAGATEEKCLSCTEEKCGAKAIAISVLAILAAMLAMV